MLHKEKQDYVDSIRAMENGEQKYLRAFYTLFDELNMTMVDEVDLIDCLVSGIYEICRLQQVERKFNASSM